MAHVGQEERLRLVGGIRLLACGDEIGSLLIHQALQVVPVTAEFQLALDVLGDVPPRAPVADETPAAVEQGLAVDLVPAQTHPGQVDGIAQHEPLTRAQSFAVCLRLLLVQFDGQIPQRLAQRPVTQGRVVPEHGVHRVARVWRGLPETIRRQLGNVRQPLLYRLTA